ncbi:hypothetical protein Pint_27910 [Pistacia integerrima]|uniref:Uncharacterized protein n=1 Tax=Pistacia integerrima TaxID=434235 RepID=A0ACC0YR18_9ROSI|nr:hypothetical protein Pint_27910 [Pistacia integerrima]
MGSDLPSHVSSGEGSEVMVISEISSNVRSVNGAHYAEKEVLLSIVDDGGKYGEAVGNASRPASDKIPIGVPKGKVRDSDLSLRKAQFGVEDLIIGSFGQGKQNASRSGCVTKDGWVVHDDLSGRKGQGNCVTMNELDGLWTSSIRNCIGRMPMLLDGSVIPIGLEMVCQVKASSGAGQGNASMLNRKFVVYVKGTGSIHVCHAEKVVDVGPTMKVNLDSGMSIGQNVDDGSS